MDLFVCHMSTAIFYSNLTNLHIKKETNFPNRKIWPIMDSPRIPLDTFQSAITSTSTM